jgi:acetyl-CoA C-acetyltransferase
MSDHAYIVAAARTPIGSFQGSLAALTAPQLGATRSEPRSTVPPSTGRLRSMKCIMGNVIAAGLKQAPARQAMRRPGCRTPAAPPP